MNTPSETFLTVRQHADALARECYGDNWRQRRNEPLEQLLPAIWLDEFEDEKLRRLLLDRKDAGTGSLSVRTLLYKVLPKGAFWVPDAVKKAQEVEYLWGEMAALHPSDYDDQWRCSIIEQVVIPGSVFERWKKLHWQKPVRIYGDAELDQYARRKGGSQPKWDTGLQEFVIHVRDKLKKQGMDLTLGTLKIWLSENAPHDDLYVPGILDCDDVYYEEDKVSWTDRTGRKHDRALKSLERYIRRAKIS